MGTMVEQGKGLWMGLPHLEIQTCGAVLGKPVLAGAVLEK